MSLAHKEILKIFRLPENGGKFFKSIISTLHFSLSFVIFSLLSHFY